MIPEKKLNIKRNINAEENQGISLNFMTLVTPQLSFY